jgi:hypothetical protein
MKRIYIKAIPVYLIIAVVITCLAAASAFAGLAVTGSKIEDSITAGAVKSYTISVADTTTEPMDIGIEIRGFGNYLSGSLQPLEPEQDLSPYSAREWTSASPSSFHLDPGGSQAVTVTINVPNDIGDGGRYAIVYIHNNPSSTSPGNVSFVTAIAAQVILTIEGSNLVRTGQIMSVDVPQPQSEQLFATTATIQNTGNYHYKVTCNGTVTDNQGQVVGTAWQTNSPYNLIPTFSQQIAIPLNISKELQPGTYYLTIEADTQDGTLLDTRTTAFVLTQSYKPMLLTPLTVEFWDQGKLSIQQWSMAQDGTLMEDVNAASLAQNVGIHIDQGTKVAGAGGGAPAPISVTTMDQPPTPPVNYSVAKAYEFNPSGITFDRPANITLGYTAKDIPNGVDESQLRVATFNVDTFQWAFLESQVDTKAHTITFPTTHFSVYAIVSPPGQGYAGVLGIAKSTWLWIGVGVLLVVVLAVSIWTVQRRRTKASHKHKNRQRRQQRRRPQGPKNDEW